MNRILFETGECRSGELVLKGPRARHIREVLRSREGDSLKTGEINGPVSSGTVLEISDDRIVLQIDEGERPPRPRLDLILALPRPKVLNRLLPQIASLGVNRLFLTNASRVERYYFDCHVLEPDRLRERLIEGLTQSGDTGLPEVRILKRLRHFMEDECPGFFAGQTKWLIHPGAGFPLIQAEPGPRPVTLAIGPEGGWIPSELEGFQQLGFEPVHLGTRILRSDTACLLALGIAAQKTAQEEAAS